MWGVHTIHRFANMNNTKLPRYNSLSWDHRTSAIDAFTSNWRGENNWIIPSGATNINPSSLKNKI
jgi:hypothetical protein